MLPFGDMDITDSTISLSVLCISYDSWVQILRSWEIKQKEIDWEEKKWSREHSPKTRVSGLGRGRNKEAPQKAGGGPAGGPLLLLWLRTHHFCFSITCSSWKVLWESIFLVPGKDQGTTDPQMKSKSLDLPPDHAYTTEGEAFAYEIRMHLGRGMGTGCPENIRRW